MILRNKRINKHAEEIQLSVSYGQPDVKKMIQWVFNCYYFHGCAWLLTEKLESPHSEQDLIELLKNDPNCFGNYESKWAQQLSEWAFNACLRLGFLKKSATNENRYYFTELCVPKKAGRPPKLTKA